MLYGLVLILTVEIPDLESDRPAGKNNWIVRYGRQFGFLAVGLSLLLATAYFFLFPVLVSKSAPFNVSVIGWLSLLTLVPGLWGLSTRPRERHPATQIATLQVITLAAFTVLVDGYLLLHTLSL
jgi:1,4-dihydroxy-2-naphthoate octaprenyltransferase